MSWLNTKINRKTWEICMAIITHERVKLTGGLLSATGLLYGLNALQAITIARHTPRTPQQAIGLLGIVDYTSASVTSDVTLSSILTEGCNKADTATKLNSAYKYAGKQVTIGVESYVLTSAGVNFQAGNPATADFGWLTSGLASYLDTVDEASTPEPSSGEESDYAVVMGDDGSGCKINAVWDGVTPTAGFVPIIDASGVLKASQLADSGVPAGVSSMNFNSRINRDQVMDVRTTSPISFVTTYPVDCSLDMEVYEDAVAAGTVRIGETGFDVATYQHVWGKLQQIDVAATALGKHRTATPPAVLGASKLANDGDVYVRAIGTVKVDETETISVGRYFTRTINYNVADILLPLPNAS